MRDAAEPAAAPDSSADAEQAGKSPPAPAQTSAVQRLFGGELASTVVCAGCGHTSTAVEPFMCVSVHGKFDAHTPHGSCHDSQGGWSVSAQLLLALVSTY